MEDFRLPRDITPQTYNLDIIVDLDEYSFNFNGIVSIKVLCSKPTKSITLHSSDLIIQENDVSVKELPISESQDSLLIKEQVYIPGSQIYRIILDQTLVSSKKYQINIPFKGNISTGLVGLYRSSYIDRDTNTTKWIASTHFEPIYARKAFPCFDEPSIKATFNIRLGHKNIYNSLSNMPLQKSYPMPEKDDWIWNQFQETIPISTYLVSYVIGNFAFKEAEKQSNNVTVKIWARPDVLDQMDFAKEFAPVVLEYFEKFFKIKYPLPKLDLIAIPDFSIGAMENWGLISFRETGLLYNEKGSTIMNKQRISYLIAHEISHQWFGNLVTIKWWTDLWLKEGFATFFGIMGVHALYPQWDYVDEAVTGHLEHVLFYDSLESSHPVYAEISNPSEIAQIFDAISYSKGALIIRMMNIFLDKSLQPGLCDYLMEYKNNCATQDDLWNSLTNRAHKDGVLNKNMTVKLVMDTWTLQTGYPLVTVQRNYENRAITVTQQRYLQKAAKGNNKECWRIPLTYTTSSELNFSAKSVNHWLDKDVDVIHVDVKPEDWIIFNVQVAGLYRVQYDIRNWKMIIETLNSENYNIIPPINRIHLMFDVFDLARSGNLDYSLALDMVKYLNRETKYVVLKFGLGQLDKLKNLLVRTSIYGYFKTYIRNLIEPIYAQYDNLLETEKDIRTHALITDWACKFDIEKCIQQALKLFIKWQGSDNPDDNNPIPTDIRQAVYSTAIRHGDSSTWNFLWDRYKNSKYATERITILRSLSCSRDIWILNRYLEWSLSETYGIRRQDSATVFAAVINQPTGGYVADAFFRRRVQDIIKFHSQKTETLESYLYDYARRLIYPNEIEEWKTFININLDSLKGASLAAKQSIDMAVHQGDWIDSYYNKVARLLSSSIGL